jgi:hypothetical protein
MGEDREEDRKTYMRREVRSPGRRTKRRGERQIIGAKDKKEGRWNKKRGEGDNFGLD